MKLTALLRLRCPICGKGKLFEGYFDSPVRCPSCGYYFMRESGYFLPHVVIGYAFTVLVALGAVLVVQTLLVLHEHAQDKDQQTTPKTLAAASSGNDSAADGQVQSAASSE